jgi:hypothetical protein
VGWRIGLRPTAAGVCHAVRSAILSVGAPAHWYRDNGREFMVHRLGGQPDRLLNPRQKDLRGRRHWPCALPGEVEQCGIWAALGIDVTTALPYRAWSKPVESFFRAFSLRGENELPGWCGRTAQGRPAALEGQIEDGLLLTLAEFEALFARQAEEWNTGHTCGERAGAPADIYRQAREGGWRPRWVTADALTYLLQDQREVKVQTEGVVLENAGRKYRFFSPQIALYVGTRVRVRWDPEAPDCIYVYTADGKAYAVPPAKAARYGEWGDANLEAARGRRVQQQYLAERVAEHRGATPPERLDTTGAVALIQERRERIAAQRQKRTEAEEQAAQLAAEQAKAREEADRVKEIA